MVRSQVGSVGEGVAGRCGVMGRGAKGEMGSRYWSLRALRCKYGSQAPALFPRMPKNIQAA